MTNKEPTDAGNKETCTYGIIDPDYARVFTIARCIAWSKGYCACLNGSFTRDLDILIVPWTAQARGNAETIVARIAEATDLKVARSKTVRDHGRESYTLLFPKFGDPRFVDISVFTHLSPLDNNKP